MCADILRIQGFEHVESVGRTQDRGVDLIAEFDGKRVAVEIKHTKRLHLAQVAAITDRVQASSHRPLPDRILIMTSAGLSPEQRSSIEQLKPKPDVHVLDGTEILRIVREHPEIARARLRPARRRTLFQRIAFIAGVAGLGGSIAAFVLSGSLFFGVREKDKLQDRIESVERAIGSLNDLENQLTEIKKDMSETERARKQIEAEYAQAKELEKLTAEQRAAIKTALQAESWQKTVLNWVFGFFSGIFSSIVGSVIYSRARQHFALEAEQ